MTRKQQLQVLARMRNSREQQLAAKAAEARTCIEQQRYQLEELQRWQADYLERGPGQDNSGSLGAMSLAHWRRFLDDLEVAIQRQREAIGRSERWLENILEEWRHASAESRAVTSLEEKYRNEQQLFEYQLEQDEADDRVNHAGHGGEDFR